MANTLVTLYEDLKILSRDDSITQQEFDALLRKVRGSLQNEMLPAFEKRVTITAPETTLADAGLFKVTEAYLGEDIVQSHLETDGNDYGVTYDVIGNKIIIYNNVKDGEFADITVRGYSAFDDELALFNYYDTLILALIVELNIYREVAPEDLTIPVARYKEALDKAKYSDHQQSYSINQV